MSNKHHFEATDPHGTGYAYQFAQARHGASVIAQRSQCPVPAPGAALWIRGAFNPVRALQPLPAGGAFH